MNDDLGYSADELAEYNRLATQDQEVNDAKQSATADQKEATAPAPQQTNNDVTATDSKPEPKQEEQQQGFDMQRT